MQQYFLYRRVTGVTTILSALSAAACLYVGARATNYDFDAFANASLVLKYAHSYRQAYWFLILDLFGYYLLLLPAVFFLYSEYKSRSIWTPLISCCGTFYIFSGAIGAAVLAAVWPDLMTQHIIAAAHKKEIIQAVFGSFTHAVTKGVWNILNAILAGCWWLGTSASLYRDSRLLGSLTFVLGLACLMDAFGEIAGLPGVAAFGLNVYLALGVLWPAMIGTEILRGGAVFTTTKNEIYTAT